MLTKSLLSVALLVLLGYGLLEAYPLIAGPGLTINSPANYATSPDGKVEISGKATRTVALTINGAPVLATADGAFSTSFVFPKGDTILTFVARDRFERTRIAERTISVP